MGTPCNSASNYDQKAGHDDRLLPHAGTSRKSKEKVLTTLQIPVIRCACVNIYFFLFEGY